MAHRRPLYRKNIKHYDEPGHLHELTFSCYRRMPLLTNDRWHALLAKAVDRAIERHAYRLVAFVFMPEHVHLIICPTPAASAIAEFLKAVKRPFAWRIKRLLAEQKSPLLQRLTIQQRPGITTFRFWQEGPGYDRNLTEVSTALAAIDYVHLNPVRRGLVGAAGDWRWSSARWYLDPRGPTDADLPTIHGLSREWLDRSR